MFAHKMGQSKPFLLTEEERKVQRKRIRQTHKQTKINK